MSAARSLRPMSSAQRKVLEELHSAGGRFDGYAELMLQTGLTSYKAIDWVLDALERRGLVVKNGHGDGYDVTPAGAAAVAGYAQVEERLDYSCPQGIAMWWPKDGAWHIAIPEAGRKGLFWTADQYPTRAAAITALGGAS